MAKVTIIPSKINPITHQHLDVKVKRKGRKDRMPFIPFLFLADLLLMIC